MIDQEWKIVLNSVKDVLMRAKTALQHQMISIKIIRLQCSNVLTLAMNAQLSVRNMTMKVVKIVQKLVESVLRPARKF